MPDRAAGTTPASSLCRFRACFTAPGGQAVHFYWLYARDEDDAQGQSKAYAGIHGFEGWTMGLWKPEAVRV